MKVFIGSSEESIKKMNVISGIVTFCGHTPLPWNKEDIFIPGRSLQECLEACAKKVDAAIFIYSHDDKVEYRGKIYDKARDNVVYEHGMFRGVLGKGNVAYVYCEGVRLPSDIIGEIYILYAQKKKMQRKIKAWLESINNSKQVNKNKLNVIMSNKLIRALVFGTTGTGKTTICNYLSGEKRPVSDGVIGTTFETYTYPFFELNNASYILTDTIGLNESEQGTIPSHVSLQKLIGLLKGSGEGYNLLVHVIKVGKMDKVIVDNYKLFVELIAGNKIPVILVATNGDSLSDKKPMSAWAADNKNIIEDKLGLHYSEIVVTSFHENSSKPAMEEIYSEYREQSIEALSNALKKHSTISSVKIYETNRDFVSVLKRVWNYFCVLLELPSLKVKIAREVRILLRNLGIGDMEIEKIIEEEKLE